MGKRGQQLQNRFGLAETVRKVAKGLDNVISVDVTSVQGCKGDRKVKLPTWWRIEVPAVLTFKVFDTENGECNVVVRTEKPWAIIVAIRGRLRRKKIHVC
jgi:hypothetical protein